MDIESKVLLVLVQTMTQIGSSVLLALALVDRTYVRKKPMPELTTNPDAIEITKVDLYNTFLVWEASSRAGDCLTEEECLAMPVEQRAEESSDHCWTLLLSGVKA